MNINKTITIREDVVNRFIKYVKIDTQSKEDAEQIPSTEKQFDLANILVSELKELGIKDAHVDKHCYVMATLPSNLSDTENKKVPKVGFIAHLDTSPDSPGNNVEPIIHKNYKGGDIVLPKNNVIIKADENPLLKDSINDDIITSNGTTLLGADDKAGVAEIMTAINYLVNNPDVKHGDIKIGFTPDEEVGRGADLFDVAKFGADFAYTLDGSTIGELEKETFNAFTATIKITGFMVHPGYAKNKMVNAARIACDIISKIPCDRVPETTEEREGYIHLHGISGDVEKASLKVLLRDFEMEGIEKSKNILNEIIASVKDRYPKAIIEMDIAETYKNMRYKIEEQPIVIDCAVEAIKKSKIEPKIRVIRGGTDGSRLSYMGLLTPNLFTGGQNFHSVTEWIPAGVMAKAVETIVNLSQIYVEKHV